MSQASADVALQAKAIRELRGLSQTDLARLMGTGQSFVSRIESGKNANLQLETLEALAGALGVRLVIELKE